MQWRREERAQRFQPYPKLRKDVVFTAAQRFPNRQNEVTREQQSWPLSNLRTTFVLVGRQRGVGREALIFACMLEAEAIAYIPKSVAKTWSTYLRKGADSSQGKSPTMDTHRDNDGITLLDLCRILENLPEFWKCIDTQIHEQKDDKLIEIKISERRLRRAAELWWQIDGENAWAPSKHPNAETEKY